MSSIRSELNTLIDPKNRSRNPLSVGLFHIFLPIFLSICIALVTEGLASIKPDLEILFKAAAVLILGTRWRSLGNIIHECSHGVFVENMKHNEFLGHLVSSFEFSDFDTYCRHHQTHHAHLGDPEQDLDFKARRLYLADSTPNLRRVVVTVFSAAALFPLWLKQTRPVVWSKNNPMWVNLLRVLLLGATLVGLSHSLTSSHVFFYVVLPFATSYQWMRLLSDCADHIFLYDRPNEIDRSRNHIFHSAWLNILLFPRNDAYHLVHHLFPTLPTRSYPDVHLKFLSNPWYAKKQHTFDIFRTISEPRKLRSQGQSR